MAITEVDSLTKFKDKDGNITVIYPTTKIGNVIGLDELIRNQSITTTGDGAAYIASVEGVSELTAGVSFVMIPHVESTTTEPTINVNELGAAGIRRRLSEDVNSTYAGPTYDWLKASKPIRVTYDGTFWIADLLRPSATDLLGIVPIDNGGTGASTAEEARVNILPAVTSEDEGKNLCVSEDGVWVVGKTTGLATAYITAPAGVTVTATKGDEVVEAIADDNGLAIFGGLSIGTWTISISNDLQTQTRTVIVGPDYTTSIKFFEATITVSYPAGSTCTCTNGDYTFTASDTSGSHTFTVFKTGTWTVTATDGTDTDSEAVYITADGQSESVTLNYFASYINVTYPSGSTLTCTNGSTTLTATTTTGSYTFTVKNTGTWTVTSTDGSQTASATVSITADGQSESVSLTYFAATIAVTFPEGYTCTCSDGSTTMTAPTTSGSYTFIVPNAGDWTVSCTNGSYTGSTTVTITTSGESQSVELRCYLYSPGDEHTENGGNWVTAAKNISSDGGGANDLTLTLDAAGMTIAQTATNVAKGGICYKANPIDLTDASTIVVKADVGTKAMDLDNRRSFNVWSSIGDYIISNRAAYNQFGTKTGEIEVELDVSSLTGEYVVGFGLYKAQSILVTEVVIS